MQFVCTILPWIGGSSMCKYNGIWINDFMARRYICCHSTPAPTPNKPYHHIVRIYLPRQLNSIIISPTQSITFDNNSEPIKDPNSDLSGNFFLVPKAHFNCVKFMACTSSHCVYHNVNIPYINCTLQRTSPSHGNWVTKGWCNCNGQVCLEIRSSGIGCWLEALYNSAGRFPMLSLYYINGSDYVIM